MVAGMEAAVSLFYTQLMRIMFYSLLKDTAANQKFKSWPLASSAWRHSWTCYYNAPHRLQSKSQDGQNKAYVFSVEYTNAKS